ncbi:MAG TPA: Crp/Fnr family transcriptional regulator [Pyrinomonadaceae bacterium]|nr:Crp/Fnr family transcriptional regulator [Pyrinomonadaceae bacterium]
MFTNTLTAQSALTENHILASLPGAARGALLAHSAPAYLDYQRTVYEAGDSVRQVFFPIACVLAEVAIMNDGTTVETGMVGREGAVGVTSAFGEYGARCWTRVLIPGDALHALLLGYYRSRISHVSRRAICNARHRLHERVCTWLLMLCDRAPHKDIPLTQEAVARQLGARRAGVNEVMVALQRYGVVEHRRGHIRIEDRERLEAMACLCYGGHRDDFEWRHVAPQGRRNVGGGGLTGENAREQVAAGRLRTALRTDY